jgi:hypothetical protein
VNTLVDALPWSAVGTYTNLLDILLVDILVVVLANIGHYVVRSVCRRVHKLLLYK